MVAVIQLSEICREEQAASATVVVPAHSMSVNYQQPVLHVRHGVLWHVALFFLCRL